MLIYEKCIYTYAKKYPCYECRFHKGSMICNNEVQEFLNNGVCKNCLLKITCKYICPIAYEKMRKD